MRRRGDTTTIAGFRAAVYVTGHTIEGQQLCLITTALFSATEPGADVMRTSRFADRPHPQVRGHKVSGYERGNTPRRRPAWRRP